MLFRTPSYYNSFRCVADKCTDNCCIGWEIDIDRDTKEYYGSVGGSFGKRLCESISEEGSFILQGERCPFLNPQNLCDIIINCGEEHLCQICRDHPRFFEWYGNIKEGGIGLSCEEGARLILTDSDCRITEAEVAEEEEEVDEELFSLLLNARDEIFSILGGGSALKDKLCRVLDFSERLQFVIDNRDTEAEYTPDFGKGVSDFSEIIALYAEFEPIDGLWQKEYSILRKSVNIDFGLSEAKEKYILNICRYFIWRYFLKGVFDEEILSKVKFAVVSALVIYEMTEGDEALSVWIEKSKLYSKQMEYSDENRELFYDYCYEKECLSLPSLAGLIKNI